MKSFISPAICCVVLLAGCARPPAPETRLLAGAFVANVTPTDWPLPMVGTFGYRPATGAHDPLGARALVLDDGEDRVAIAVVDSCYVPREVFDEAKRRASAATGIPADRMLISATHTHSAPPPAPGVGLRGVETEDLSANEAKYAALFVHGIADAIVRANDNREPAEIGWQVEQLPGEVFNRRWFMKQGSIPPDPFGGTTDKVRMNPPRASPDLVRPAGPTDPDVTVVSVRTADGRPLALLANYSLHYVGGTGEGQVSADYFGEFARQVAERLDAGPDFVAILSNGTSGNINNIDFTKPRERREPFEQIRKVSGEVADLAREAYGEIQYRPWVDLAMDQTELTLARRKPTEEGYAQAKRTAATVNGSQDPQRLIYAQRAIDAYEGPESVDVIVQAIRVGELGIAALPFETFAEMGLEIKEKSPFPTTFTIELANGANGYLPTPEQHELGGYETWLGTNTVEKQASVKLTATLLDLLRGLAPAASPQ